MSRNKIQDLYDSMVSTTHSYEGKELAVELNKVIEYHKNNYGITEEEIDKAIKKYEVFAKMVGGLIDAANVLQRRGG